MNALLALRPCKAFGRSTSGILARPLPKGAGLRQGSLVSNTTIIRDTRNAQITQNLSAVKTEGSPPRLSPFPQTPPTPHYPSPRAIPILNPHLKQGCFTAVAQSLYARTHKDSRTKPLHDATAQMAVNARTNKDSHTKPLHDATAQMAVNARTQRPQTTAGRRNQNYSSFITHKNPAVPFPKQQGHKY